MGGVVVLQGVRGEVGDWDGDDSEGVRMLWSRFDGDANANSFLRASSAAMRSSTVGGGVCGIELGGKRRKKLRRGLGRDLASFWYCAIEPMVSIGCDGSKMGARGWSSNFWIARLQGCH